MFVWRVLIGFVVAKAATMATVLYLVLASSLTDFEKGLIIAAVSATITGLFLIGNTFLSAKLQKPMVTIVEEVHQDVHDVKRKVGASKRADDPPIPTDPHA